MARSITRIAVLLVLSAAGAIAQSRLHNLPWWPAREEFDERQSLKEAIRKDSRIDLVQFKAAIEQGAIVIDAREQVDFEKAHLDLGADALVPTLNVEPDDVDRHMDRLMTAQGMPFVLYCNSATCDLAEDLLIALVERGFVRDDLKIYRDGWEGLVAAGLASRAGSDTWPGLSDLPVEAQLEPAPMSEEAAP